MAVENKQAQEMASVIDQIMIQAAQGWQDMMRSIQSTTSSDSAGETAEPGKTGEKWDPDRFRMETAYKNWHALFESLARPETQSSLYLGFGSDLVSSLADSSWQIFAGLQQLWSEQLQKTKEFANTNDHTAFDGESLQQWAEFYDKEFRKFLKVPQLGLTRYHQEKLNRMIDRYNAMQLEISEFYNLLFKPLRDATVSMQEQISKWTDEGRLPDDPKLFYRHWMKLLEERYMMLFRSEDYIKGLQRALYANLEYRNARKEVLEELFRYFSMPTGRDINEVYEELYHLKKQVKSLEQQLQGSYGNIAPAAAAS